ncbi:VCBS repeat-containing protein [Streptomyces griseus]|uniref:FG-GAP repeat domain-containing protein n=1 Tax=Streptomyces griseus TaxID=1911 RepID=UPI0006910601|nr:VCBS repeat-containing protein [Streptomyces griseus]
MGRHALGRSWLTAAVSSFTAAVVAASVVVTGGGGTAQAAPATAATTEITLTDPIQTYPRADRPLADGPNGFLHRQSGIPGLLWTDTTTGRTVPVGTEDGDYTPPSTLCSTAGSSCWPGWFGADSDRVALPSGSDPNTVSLWDRATRTTSSFTSPYPYRAYLGASVLTTRTVVDKVDGQWQPREISPDWLTVSAGSVMAADAGGAMVKVGTDLWYLDLGTAVATKAFLNAGSRPVVVQNDQWTGWYEAASGDLRLKSRTDPAGAERVVDLPAPGATLDGTPVMVGEWILLPLHTGTGTSRMTAMSLADGSSRTLLESAEEYTVHLSGDAALVTGGTGATDWWVRKVVLADSVPTLEKLYQVPAKENVKTGIALSRGSLRVAEDNPSSDSDTTSVRTLTTDGDATLTASPATESGKIWAKCPYAGVTCSALWGNTGTDPQDVYLTTFDDADEGGTGLPNADRLVSIGHNPLEFGTEGGSIVDVSDDYAVYNSGGASPTQYVGRFGYGQQMKRSIRATALNGSTLWSATVVDGQVTSYSLTQNKPLSTATIPAAACRPTELQAAGRWLYWACGTTSAGVYDTKAGTSVAVTPGDVLLGDGFTVRHDHAKKELLLTETATGTTRVIATDVTAGASALDRRHRWTVDEYTGLVAWFDGYERTHVATTGVTPSSLAVFESEVAGYAYPDTADSWTGAWLLSRPVTSWSLTFTSVQSGETGRATRTLTGGASTAQVWTGWNGKTATGARFPNGMFTWALRATALGTTTATAVASGSGFYDDGAPVRHDYGSVDGPDGIGDLLTLNSSGALTFHYGSRFTEKATGTGWATSITAVTFGDLSGDRCNDVLVRQSNGSLRLYRPGCGRAVTPSTAYTTVGTSGWGQYDILTSTGDVSGDGRPDLVARNSATGDIYLYKGTSTGGLSARAKIFADWRTYKKIVGVGDITGDGVGDLIAQDKSNNLYRYDGTRTGTFKARVKVFANWGGAYNAVAGLGDMTGDGKADLVARDTSGNLYRHNGDGKGSFGAGTKIATGWGGYKTLS